MPMLGDIKLHQCDIPIAFKVNAPGASRYIDERLKNQKFLQCTKCGPGLRFNLTFINAPGASRYIDEVDFQPQKNKSASMNFEPQDFKSASMDLVSKVHR